VETEFLPGTRGIDSEAIGKSESDHRLPLIVLRIVARLWMFECHRVVIVFCDMELSRYPPLGNAPVGRFGLSAGCRSIAES
jgi:hypothetical protein